MLSRLFFPAVLLLAFIGLTPANSQSRDVPYWASLRSEEVNMRVGPSVDYPIEWVYKRQGLPVKVLRVREGWRFVQDPDGAQGWVVASLLTPTRAAIVIGEGLTEIRAEPDAASNIKWRAEPGVVARLRDCVNGWCEVDAGGRVGWVLEARLWGAGEP